MGKLGQCYRQAALGGEEWGGISSWMHLFRIDASIFEGPSIIMAPALIPSALHGKGRLSIHQQIKLLEIAQATPKG